MKNKESVKNNQLGYFIDFNLWKDAWKLLEYQINRKEENRYFATLSMFYYEKLTDKHLLNTEDYFNTKVSNNLFYGLQKEFAIYPYLIPKSGLGLRAYKFLTYPMRVLYYSIGLYLLQLSQEFLDEIHGKISTIFSFYGGGLRYKSKDLNLNPETIYYRKWYDDFVKGLSEEKDTIFQNKNKFELKLDIENYFDQLSIPKLLDLLSNFIKPSTQEKMSYNASTKEQIICLFEFISTAKIGIPQSDNNIISDFLGFLYLAFGDLFIHDLLLKLQQSKGFSNLLNSYKIIRYVDDIHIILEFKENTCPKLQKQFIHEVAYQVTECLYTKLGLKVNRKSRVYNLMKKKDRKKSDQDTLEGSLDDHQIENKTQKVNSDSPEEKINKIFKQLKKLKTYTLKDVLTKDIADLKQILHEIFNDKKVDQMLAKKENKQKIRQIFKDFNYNLVKIQALPILVIMLKDETTKNEFKNFWLTKDVITTSDADLIIKFLCQTKFKLDSEELIKKLCQNTYMNDIMKIFQSNKINDETGYYDINYFQKIQKLSTISDVIEQIRLRVLNEKNRFYSVALNHLVNEIHRICMEYDPEFSDGKNSSKKYDVNNVIEFLDGKSIPSEIWIQIRNLFDRRNSNSISHPNNDMKPAKGVTKEEYEQFRKMVGQCIDLILS